MGFGLCVLFCFSSFLCVKSILKGIVARRLGLSRIFCGIFFKTAMPRLSVFMHSVNIAYKQQVRLDRADDIHLLFAVIVCRRRAKSAKAAATSDRARHTISARLSPVRARAAKMFDEFGGVG